MQAVNSAATLIETDADVGRAWAAAPADEQIADLMHTTQSEEQINKKWQLRRRNEADR